MTSEMAGMVRRGQRLIRMVSELHRLGFQRLRIMPYEAEQGCRLLFGPVDGFSSLNGAYWARTLAIGGCDHIIVGPSDWPPFGWIDANTDNARQLADKFILRFPDLCAESLGRDWHYAGWLSELLGVLEATDALPVTMLDYMSPKPWDMKGLVIRSYGKSAADREFDLPPPGLMPDRRVTDRSLIDAV